VYTMDTGAIHLYSVVIPRQSSPAISQFDSPCNEFTSVWSMFVYTNCSRNLVVFLNTVL